MLKEDVEYCYKQNIESIRKLRCELESLDYITDLLKARITPWK
jgi:hypothetical protein